MSRYKQIIFPALIIALMLASCSKTVYPNLWPDQPVTKVNPAKWSIPLRFYDSKSKLQYSIYNDMENLYVCIRVTDDQTEMKIIRGGIQLWIDTTGKKKHQVGLLFPLPDTEHHKGSAAGAGHMQRNAFHRKLNGFSEMRLAGFKAPIGGQLMSKNEYGITAHLERSGESILTYEAVIPFKTFYRNKLSASDSTKTFGLTITVNGVPVPSGTDSDHPHHHGGAQDNDGDNGDMNPNPGGMPGEGIANDGMSGGGYGAGGMGPGGGYHHNMPQEGDKAALFESSSVSLKIRLASK